MSCNLGTYDRVARVVIGLAVGAAGLYFKSWFGLIGLVPLGTALVGWCPLYVPLGLSTCKAQTEGN